MRRRRLLSNVAIVIGTVAVLPATIAILWTSGWYSGLSRSGAQTAAAGVVEGYVWDADEDSGTVRVTSNLFGINALPIAVTHETRVVVGDKEGGFGDLHEGVSVRVTYERRETQLVALCVETEPRGEEVTVGSCLAGSLAHIPR